MAVSSKILANPKPTAQKGKHGKLLERRSNTSERVPGRNNRTMLINSRKSEACYNNDQMAAGGKLIGVVTFIAASVRFELKMHPVNVNRVIWPDCRSQNLHLPSCHLQNCCELSTGTVEQPLDFDQDMKIE